MFRIGTQFSVFITSTFFLVENSTIKKSGRGSMTRWRSLLE